MYKRLAVTGAAIASVWTASVDFTPSSLSLSISTENLVGQTNLLQEDEDQAAVKAKEIKQSRYLKRNNGTYHHSWNETADLYAQNHSLWTNLISLGDVNDRLRKPSLNTSGDNHDSRAPPA